MPSQKGIFPKTSLNKNPKIDPFPPTTKPHPLNPLIVGPPLLYWLGTNGWCFGPCVCIPLPFAFVFLYSHAIFAVFAMSHSVMCLLCSCLSSMAWKAWALGLVLFPLISLWAWTLAWQKSLPIQFVGLLLLLLLFLLCLWACWLSFMSCWPIGLITSFLGFFRLIYFTFTSLLCL